jgi:hydroxymethylpyrimidine pyrophosphatase-like HAD family hydrolase
MFRKSGFSIAMGNAEPDVKREADAVTDSYNNEGFARAIEQLILNPARAEDAR